MNFIVRFLGSLLCLLARRPGRERRGGEPVRPCFPARQLVQLDLCQAEFARWERAENRFRREWRRVWWLDRCGIGAGPSPVLGAVVR